MKQLTNSVYLWKGSVTGGILVRDGHGLLLDCPEFPWDVDAAGELQKIGIHTVDGTLLTQHRRAHAGGITRWQGDCPPVWATAPEAKLLENAGKVWTTSHGKYHRYECIPDRFSPFESIQADRILQDGEVICWHGLKITPVVFGALSHGDCAYVVEADAEVLVFCGALAMAGGRIPELCSFQKALPDMMGYHGYLAGLVDWCRGMEKLKKANPHKLVPAYGPVENDPIACLTLLEQRLREYAKAYVDISAVRYYFPAEFHAGFEVPMGLTQPPVSAPLGQHPAWLSRIGETTSYLLKAPSGRAILIDAGDREAVEAVLKMTAEGEISHLDACWITHAHDDHLNSVWMLVHEFDCPLLSTASVAEVCGQPAAWFLPALPDCNVKFEVVPDAHTWEWEGFALTALHLPGQCIAHAGLLVQKDTDKVLLCGDSFAPTGLDDYCAENRNLTGVHRGYGLCVELLRKYGISQLVNQHQTEPFIYDGAYLTFLEQGMARREELLAKLLPGDIGFGIDRQWLRAWPMEQTVTQGAPLRLSVQITGHGCHEVRISPRLPWSGETQLSATVHTLGLTSGSTQVEGETMSGDIWSHFDISAPEKGTWLIPFDCWLDGIYLGSFANCSVHVI